MKQNSLQIKILNLLRLLLFPNGKLVFAKTKIPIHGKILDVGCGNNSPKKIKQIRPDLYYVGLDIGIYNQSDDINSISDEFILTTPELFHEEIENKEKTFNAVISAHNLEHCNEPDKVLTAMSKSLLKDGLLYLAFPSEASLKFPSRKGTLNFLDDPTHHQVPNLVHVISILESNNMTILKLVKRNRPIIPFLIGLIFEPLGRMINRQAPFKGTWALYGFETIIVARKNV